MESRVVHKKWITFRLFEEKPKTEIWAVLTKGDKLVLGVIRWHGPWRSYAFFPKGGTLYEEDCLRDIADFIEEKMKEWRQKKK